MELSHPDREKQMLWKDLGEYNLLAINKHFLQVYLGKLSCGR